MTEPKLYEVLKRASLFLEEHQAEPRVAEILLQHHLGMDRNAFFMHMRDPVPANALALFKSDLQRHVETGVPVQHLIGSESFYDRTFQVNEHVLIPRPETEEVVQEAIRLAKKHAEIREKPLIIVDIGTGSGVIAITLALELAKANVSAIDLSERALQTAKQNADKHAVDIQFLHGSFLEPLIQAGQKVDMIVSNPPYIPYQERANLSRTVTAFDPEMALFAEHDGLAAYEAIVQQAKQVLQPDGILVFEIGHDQGEKVPASIRAVFPDALVRTIQDINGKDRIVTACLKEK